MISVLDQPWLTGLFGDPVGHAPWQPARQMAHYVAFEIALARALESTGRVAPGVGRAAEIALQKFQPDLVGLSHATARDGVPVPDLVRQIRVAAGDAHPAVHTGATSQDVLDTALVLTLKDVSAIVAERLIQLIDALSALSQTHGAVRMMGRTRMQAAKEITVADRIATWRTPLVSHLQRLQDLRPLMAQLQLGGAVGNNAAFGRDAPEIAQNMATDLGLSPSDHVWHSDRTRIVEYTHLLSLITGSLGKFGQDIALMAQQGVDEVRMSGGGTSSAMPHKSNPVLAELLVTLARFNAAQSGLMHQSMVHEQERSGSAWMLEWMVVPQVSGSTCTALKAALDLCAQIEGIGHL